MDTILIRKMEQKDLKEVLKIYQEGIDTGMATFQTEVPSEWNLFSKACSCIIY